MIESSFMILTLAIDRQMLSSMRRFLLSIFLLITLASIAGGQTPANCGIVGIDGAAKVQAAEPLVFTVKTAGLSHLAKVEIKWKVSAGTITSGDGTDTINVDTVNLGGQNVTATAELLETPVGCNGSASKTTEIAVPPIVCGLPFDRYGDLRFNDEKARLDNFAIQIMNVPTSTGYIFAYAGQVTFKNETRQRLARAKSYMVKVRGVDPKRIITVDCGFDSDLWATLMIAPQGVSAPECVAPSLPLSQVKFTKPRPGSIRRRSTRR